MNRKWCTYGKATKKQLLFLLIFFIIKPYFGMRGGNDLCLESRGEGEFLLREVGDLCEERLLHGAQ